MKQLLFSLFIFLFCGHLKATTISVEDSVKAKACKWYCPKINCKELCKQIKFFGKSSDAEYRYSRAYFDVGAGAYVNPAATNLQNAFVINGYSDLSPSNGMLGDTRSVSGKPVVYGKKNIQFHIGFGFNLNRFLELGIEFRNIPAMYVNGYLAKQPYDYANPDLVQERISATSTQYKVNILVLTLEQNHRKFIDLSVGAAMVHYTFDIQTQLNINQYDTITNKQIVSQSNVSNSSKVWGEGMNLHADIYFSKNFSLQLSGETFFNVVASVPLVQYADGPFNRVVGAHTLNYLNTTFSGALAFHF